MFVLTCASKRFIELCNTFAKKLLLLRTLSFFPGSHFMNGKDRMSTNTKVEFTQKPMYLIEDNREAVNVTQ